MQEREAGNASLASDQSRLGIPSSALLENHAPHITDVIGHGPHRNSRREKHHLEGTDGNDGGSDGTPQAHNHTDQASSASARTSGNRSTIQRGNGKNRLNEGGDTVRPDSARSVLPKACATVPAFRQEAELKTNPIAPPGIEKGMQVMPQQEVLNHSLRPTMKEGSIQHIQSRATGQPNGARPPIVQIRIGRIEVRAVAPPAQVLSKKNVEPLRSSMPLDQYLGRRS
ncbi:MAG TPA: hypothetical protein VJ777_23545, partial [Mycobacterium sp.]|nr:hypothetical protein [Mycobacterium sp.]